MKGNDITIPVCGNTDIGKVAVFSVNRTTCQECKDNMDLLLKVESYADACNMYTDLVSGNLEAHKADPENIALSILGDKENFWKNIQKIQR